MNAPARGARGRRGCRGRRPRLLGLGFAVVWAAAAAPAAASWSSPLVDDVANAVGFDASQMERVRRGEIVSGSLPEQSERELAIAVLMRLDESHRAFARQVRRGRLFEVDATVLRAREIPSDEGGAEAFAELSLPEEELRRLGRAGPGDDFNLASDEIERLREARPDGPPSVLAAFREVMAGRLRAYRQGGVEAIAPYARGGGQRARPARDLRRAIDSLRPLESQCPAFYQSFAAFPEASEPVVSHRFFWSLRRIQGRPTVVLSHRALRRHAAFSMVAERQFYVSRGYDALQVVVGAFSLGQGESLVLYTNRTATGRVAGFGSALAHRAGRRVMSGEVTKLFREIRAAARPQG